jgi:glycosyltransferase
MPFLSIITATYNAVATLGGCLAGIHSQSIPLEHIIIDGGSTDGTLDIVAAYRDHVTKVVSEPDKGIYDAMNKGIRLAGGEIVGVLNADDFYFDAQVLAKVAQVFENTEVDSCYGDLLYVREKRRPKVKGER